MEIILNKVLEVVAYVLVIGVLLLIPISHYLLHGHFACYIERECASSDLFSALSFSVCFTTSISIVALVARLIIEIRKKDIRIKIPINKKQKLDTLEIEEFKQWEQIRNSDNIDELMKLKN